MPPLNEHFAPGREFALIEGLFPESLFPGRFPRDGRGLGDDAFVWDAPGGSGKTWVVTSDASVERVHYRLDWTRPEQALRKALLANLSDVNAMGGRARLAFFNLGARADWGPETVAALGGVLRDLEDAFGFRVSGGDTVTLPDSSFFSFAVMGEVIGRPLLRSACGPGHRVYVSGFLGGSAAGLRLLREGGSATGEKLSESDRELLDAHLDPRPPLELGPLLASFGQEVAAIDVSDGLSSELWHLARRSRCRLRIEADKLPAHPALRGRSAADVREAVLNGGEEYQLLFTGKFSGEELARLNAIVPVSEIGRAEAGEGVLLDGAPLEAGGFSHGKPRT